MIQETETETIRINKKHMTITYKTIVEEEHNKVFVRVPLGTNLKGKAVEITLKFEDN